MLNNIMQVVRVNFSPQDWSQSDSRYTVAIEAVMDNGSHDNNFPLAPWSWCNMICYLLGVDIRIVKI